MDKNKLWQIKNKKPIFKCKIMEVHSMDCHLPSKNISNEFISMKMHDWVNVFAVTKENRVIMVKQHRLGGDIVTLEVPAGTIDENEDPAVAVERELREETGYTSQKIILLKEILVNPAIQSNRCYFYLALDCIKTSSTEFDATEEIELSLFDLNEIFNSRTNNLIENSISLLSVMLAKDFLQENNKLQSEEVKK